MNFGMNVKRKYQNKVNLCYVDTENFVIHIKTEDFHEDIANGVEKWFDTSSYDDDVDRPFPIGKSKEKIVFFKD